MFNQPIRTASGKTYYPEEFFSKFDLENAPLEEIKNAIARHPDPAHPELWSAEWSGKSGTVEFVQWVAVAAVPAKSDSINHPSHYTAYKGVEIIDLTEQMNFNRGNAVKYIARAGLKDPSKEIEDLEKARWYIDREIERLRKQ